MVISIYMSKIFEQYLNERQRVPFNWVPDIRSKQMKGKVE